MANYQYKIIENYIIATAIGQAGATATVLGLGSIGASLEGMAGTSLALGGASIGMTYASENLSGSDTYFYTYLATSTTAISIVLSPSYSAMVTMGATIYGYIRTFF